MAGDIEGISPHLSRREDDRTKNFDASNLTKEEVEDLQKVADKVGFVTLSGTSTGYHISLISVTSTHGLGVHPFQFLYY